jgi:hypothetical protein
MEALPDQEAGLQENFVNLQSIKKKFEVFEKQIFEKKFQEMLLKTPPIAWQKSNFNSHKSSIA